jgi:hypothetical protein
MATTEAKQVNKTEQERDRGREVQAKKLVGHEIGPNHEMPILLFPLLI